MTKSQVIRNIIVKELFATQGMENVFDELFDGEDVTGANYKVVETIAGAFVSIERKRQLLSLFLISLSDNRSVEICNNALRAVEQAINGIILNEDEFVGLNISYITMPNHM